MGGREAPFWTRLQAERGLPRESRLALLGSARLRLDLGVDGFGHQLQLPPSGDQASKQVSRSQSVTTPCRY